jgi:hypothetical protein
MRADTVVVVSVNFEGLIYIDRAVGSDSSIFLFYFKFLSSLAGIRTDFTVDAANIPSPFVILVCTLDFSEKKLSLLF